VTSQWRDDKDERARRYYSITTTGEQTPAAFRAEWAQFTATVGGVLNHGHPAAVAGSKGSQR
jgi:DNA-binding PadR family transcriptional regulator